QARHRRARQGVVPALPGAGPDGPVLVGKLAAEGHAPLAEVARRPDHAPRVEHADHNRVVAARTRGLVFFGDERETVRTPDRSDDGEREHEAVRHAHTLLLLEALPRVEARCEGPHTALRAQHARHPCLPRAIVVACFTRVAPHRHRTSYMSAPLSSLVPRHRTIVHAPITTPGS